jgi:hypothetical protein
MAYLKVLFLLLFSFHIFAFEACETTKFPSNSDIIWKEVGASKMYSTFLNVEGKLCVGINKFNSRIERMIYRDDTGVDRNNSIQELLNKDIILIDKKDIPSYAQVLVRSTPILTLRVLSESLGVSKNSYTLSFKFLRNVAKGFSAPDLRNLIFTTTIDKAYQTVAAYYQNSKFDEIELNISSTMKINEILFNYQGQEVGQVYSSNLPETIHLFR